MTPQANRRSWRSHAPRALSAASLALLVAACGEPARAPPSEESQPLHQAARDGDLARLRAELGAGADPDARDPEGRTALVVAAQKGNVAAVQVLVSAGADLDRALRGPGTALEAAERAGHVDVAAALLRAGARSSGRSVGDKVCVRPWGGDGYCGTVEALARTSIRIRLTELVGCAGGCAPRGECSAGRPVGGADGLRVGVSVDTDTSCLTHTGVLK